MPKRQGSDAGHLDPAYTARVGVRCLDLPDFNVGKEIVAYRGHGGVDTGLYGKRIRLVDCDRATREYLSSAGVEVPACEDVPPDDRVDPTKKPRSYDDFDLRTKGGAVQCSKGRVVKHYPDEIARTQKFLVDSGKLRYFVEDDTTEVIERAHGNSGRDCGRAFRRRCRLPRGTEQARKGLELTFGSKVNGMAGDKPTTDGQPYYVLSDFTIGAEVEVYSRVLTIFAADRFTRDYYEKHVGVALAPDAEMPVKEERIPQPRPPPRHNGFGTEEDSLSNCHSLLCKGPKVDLKKWQRHANDLLRFKMKLHEPEDANDVARRFVLTYHMADDSLVINELSIRNAGFLAGRFLKRQKVKKFAGEGPRTYFAHSDFHPGAVVTIFGHTFEVLEQDRRTDILKDPSLAAEEVVTGRRHGPLS
eukprot:gene716-1285_t